MKKTISILICAIALSVTGCGASSNNYSSAGQEDIISSNTNYNVAGGSLASSSKSYDYDYGETYEESYTDYEENTPELGNNIDKHEAEITLSEEKLVYTCNITIETTEYQNSIDSLYDIISEYGGIVQSTYEYDNANNWYYADYAKTKGTMNCEMNIRVPSSNYQAMVDGLGGIGKVKSKQSQVENISQQYYDTSTRIEVYKKEQTRLLSMLDGATTIEDMITIEQRLSEVESELAVLQTDIRYMDMDVAYSYVNVSVKEVMEYSDDPENRKTNTFVDRLKNTIEDTWKGLGSNLESLLFIIIMVVPYIVILSVILLLYNKFFKIRVKALKRKRRERKEAEKKEDGTMSIKEMNNMINNLSKEIESKKNS